MAQVFTLSGFQMPKKTLQDLQTSEMPQCLRCSCIAGCCCFSTALGFQACLVPADQLDGATIMIHRPFELSGCRASVCGPGPYGSACGLRSMNYVALSRIPFWGIGRLAFGCQVSGFETTGFSGFLVSHVCLGCVGSAQSSAEKSAYHCFVFETGCRA